MANNHPSFPFFTQVERRSLAPEERAVVERLLRDLSDDYRVQLTGLKVVGRCGCRKCPTIFFQPHAKGDRERDIASCAGTDSSGGRVGAVLLEKNGLLSQLEFFSVDGHDPWSIPDADSLEAY